MVHSIDFTIPGFKAQSASFCLFLVRRCIKVFWRLTLFFQCHTKLRWHFPLIPCWLLKIKKEHLKLWIKCQVWQHARTISIFHSILLPAGLFAMLGPALVTLAMYGLLSQACGEGQATKRSASSTNMTCLFLTNSQSVLQAEHTPHMAVLALRSVCGSKNNNTGRELF